MRTWVIALVVLAALVTFCGCSSTHYSGSTALAPATDASDSGLRSASALSWGSPIVLDDQQPYHRIGTCLTIIGGLPTVSYVVWSDQGSAAAFTLYYAQANDATGTSWGSATEVATWEYPHQYNCYTSLVEVNGKPAISYMGWDGGWWDLRYVRAKNPAGTRWGNPIVVDPAPATQEGVGATMLIVNGNPAIWYKEGFGEGKYVRALDQNGDSWGAPIYPDPAGDGFSSSFAIVNGNPAVSYVAGGDLRFLRADDASGNTWSSPQTVLAAAGPQGNSRLIVVDGCPAIAFSGYSWSAVSHLGFICAGDSNGTDWSAPPVTVTDGITNDWLGTVTVINGLPSIAFTSGINVAENSPPDNATYDEVFLSFVQALDSSGSSWETAETIANTGIYGPNPSLAAVGSGAGITFTDVSHAVNYVGSLQPPPDPGAGGIMHLEDLNASIVAGKGGRWRAQFTVTVYDSDEGPVNAADVAFTVTGDASGSGLVTTGSAGTASYQTSWFRDSASVTFTVDDITHSTLTYDPAGNHGGNSISISGP